MVSDNTSVINTAYSTVLYDYATKSNKLKEIYHDAQTVFKFLTLDNDYLFETLRNYNIPKEERKKIIDLVFDKKIDDYYILVLKAIIDFDRCTNLINITKKILAMCNKGLNIRYIKVYSAFELTDLQKDKLIKALEKHYHSKIDLNNIVVPEIIGGLKIVSEDDSINTTFISKLNRMKAKSIKAISQYMEKEDINNGQ